MLLFLVLLIIGAPLWVYLAIALIGWAGNVSSAALD